MYLKLNVFPEYQFVYPAPKGGELIVPAPFRAGVNRGNRFADWVNNQIFNKYITKQKKTICL